MIRKIKYQKPIFIIEIILLTTLLLSGCVNFAQPHQTATKKTTHSTNGQISMGFIGPLSGDAAAFGVPAQQVIKLAVEEINAKGGVNGKKISMIYEDGKCNPKDGATAAQKLVTVDKVKFIIGGICSGEMIGAATVTEQNQVLLISPGATSPEISTLGDYTFRTIPSDAEGMKKLAIYVNKKITSSNINTLGILAEQTDYAQDQKKYFLEHYKGTVVADESYTEENTDLRTQLLKIKSQNPKSLLLLPQAPQKVGPMLEQVKIIFSDNPNLQIFMNDWPESQLILNEYPHTVEGITYTIHSFEEEKPQAKQVFTKIEQRYGSVEVFSKLYYATMYDTPHLLAHTLQLTGEDPTKVKNLLYTTNWNGISGTYTFDKNGDVNFGMEVRKIENGKPKVLVE